MELKKLRELAEAATPGPWCDRGFGSIQPESGGALVAVTVTNGGCLPDYVENSAFIAAANPVTMIALLDAIKNYWEDLRHARNERDALQAKCETLRAVLQDILAAGAIKVDEYPLLMAQAKAALDGGGA